jgi:serine/threonine-protein kinase
MELVRGGSLKTWLAQQGPGLVPLDTAVLVMDGLCRGVAAIHRAGAVHRDIKPSNVLLDHLMCPRVADLGVSVLCREGARRAMRAGSPAYMAPEVAFPAQAKVDGPRPASDVYSLGCIAYELLTGRLPHPAGRRCELEAAHPISPTQLRNGLPAVFDEVIRRALDPDPKQRTATPDGLRRELRAALDGCREPSRILVAEDDADFRELLAVKLRKAFPDATLVCVDNGRSALHAFEEHGASVAILDLQMPRLDGSHLTEVLRSRPEAQHMPIIILTASGGPEEWRRLKAAGADRFLLKPVDLDDVVTLIRRAMRDRIY